MKSILILTCLAMLFCCGRPDVPGEANQISERFSLAQRKSIRLDALPQIVIKIGDITGGQVLASVSRHDSKVSLTQQSLRAYEHAQFTENEQTCYLQLIRLHDTLMSTDSADFLLTTDPDGLHEKPQPVEK